MADFLRNAGCDVTIGFYATRQHRSDLCTSTLKSWFGTRPRTREDTAFGEHQCVAVGCLNPIIESNYSRPSGLWRKLIEEHDIHIAIGGTTVIATPLADAGVPHLVWCASDVEGDRFDRRRSMPFWRRVFDRYLVTPRLLDQQQTVLGGCGRILGVSPFTTETLAQVSGRQRKDFGVVPIPTDTEFFTPAAVPQNLPVIGFAGRLDDPRKNPELLFQALAVVRARGGEAVLRVTGEKTAWLEQLAHESGVIDHVEFYRSLRVFVLTSFQEGLAIVGIEAMACGVPVVSTRCGGPEAYIRNGENGFLTDFDPYEIAEKIEQALIGSPSYEKMSLAARSDVAGSYAQSVFEDRIWEEILSVWQKP